MGDKRTLENMFIKDLCKKTTNTKETEDGNKI